MYSETEGQQSYGDGIGRHAMALCQQRKALGPPQGGTAEGQVSG